MFTLLFYRVYLFTLLGNTIEEHYDIAKHHVFLICFIQQISLAGWPVAHIPYVAVAHVRENLFVRNRSLFVFMIVFMIDSKVLYNYIPKGLLGFRCSLLSITVLGTS